MAKANEHVLLLYVAHDGFICPENYNGDSPLCKPEKRLDKSSTREFLYQVK